MPNWLTPEAWQEAVSVLRSETLFAIWETLYSTFLATAFAYLIGLPLGVILVIGESNNVRPLPAWLMSTLSFIVNILRSVPFLLLMMIAGGLAKLIIGTQVGTNAMIVSLVIAAFPYAARLVESSLRETDRGVIEAAQSMGATPFQIVWKVMLPEAMPSLVSGATIALTTILGYGAMAGIIGGGGLGKIAINYGYYRYKYIIMIAATIMLVILVQIFQSAGTRLTVKSDKRISETNNRRKKQ